MPHYRAEIHTIFGSHFGRNDDFINSFRNLLTLNTILLVIEIKLNLNKNKSKFTRCFPQFLFFSLNRACKIQIKRNISNHYHATFEKERTFLSNSYFLTLVHLIPFGLFLGRNRVYFAYCSAQTALNQFT